MRYGAGENDGIFSFNLVFAWLLHAIAFRKKRDGLAGEQHLRDHAHGNRMHIVASCCCLVLIEKNCWRITLLFSRRTRMPTSAMRFNGRLEWLVRPRRIERMINSEGYKHYLRCKINLENTLANIGDIPGSPEIESQMMFAEERLTARIKQAHHHAAQELDALRQVLTEMTKDPA